MVHYADTVAREDLIIVGTWSYNYNIINFTLNKNWDDQECIILCRYHAGCVQV